MATFAKYATGMNKFLLKILKIAFYVIGLSLFLTYLNFKIISLSTAKNIYDDINSLPDYQVMLIPGVGDSVNNYYFRGRLDAAEKIFRSKKIKTIIASGRNDLKGYDEPRDIETAMLLKNIPQEIILKDYGATRTIETILSLKKMNLDSIIIVSQQMHLERTVFIARAAGIHSIGFVAEENLPEHYKKYYLMREIIARLRCTWDFLGL